MDIKDIKSNLNSKVKLKDKDGDYLLTGCMFRKREKDFFYQAELQDLGCGHCVIIAKLEDVEEVK